MKRIISTILLLMMLRAFCMSLAACGGASVTGPDNTQTGKPDNNQTGTNQEPEYFDKLGYALPEAFEVVYNNSEVVSYRFGFAYVFTFVGLKNVTDEPILPYGLISYRLTNAEGEDVSAHESVDSHLGFSSSVLVKPGEVVYLYDYSICDKVKPDDTLTCTFDDSCLGIKSVRDNYYFYEVSDLKVTMREDGDRMDLTGILHCDEIVEGKDVTIICFGFDKSGKPVCCFSGIVSDVKAGTDVEFSAMAEVYGSVTPEDLDDNLVVRATSAIPMT